MTSIHVSRSTAGILAAALALGALGALAAPACALRSGLDPQEPTIKGSVPSTPRAFRPDVFPNSGPCPDVCRSPSNGIGTARGSDLEWAFLTLAGGPTAVLLIGFVTTRAAEHHRRQRALPPD
jgi:hypothetical protein